MQLCSNHVIIRLISDRPLVGSYIQIGIVIIKHRDSFAWLLKSGCEAHVVVNVIVQYLWLWIKKKTTV